MSTVQSSADSLLGLLNEILDFSKIEAGKMTLEAVPFSVTDVVARVVCGQAVCAHRKGLEIVYDVAPDVPALVAGDPARLGQVLLNLVANAIKFTAKGEVVVQVSMERTGQEPVIRFSVRDTGIGIPGEQQALIFEPFTQADASTTRQYGGTGLGLAICSRLVLLMNGRLWVESAPGIGSTFSFTASAKPVPEAAMAAPVAARRSASNVLVVEDNPTARRILRQFLVGHECQAMAAAGVPEALTLFGAERVAPFDAALIDGDLPGAEGLVDWLLRQPDPARITIMLTTVSLSHERWRTIPGVALATKPLGLSQLLAAIEEPTGQRLPGPTAFEPAAPTGSLRILLAEDNHVNQRVATLMLQKLGHAVSLAGNGREAVEMATELRPDLVLMDIQMPDMDGLEATAALRRNPDLRDLPVIAMTAHTLDSDRERCLRAGMNGHLAKPVQMKALRDALAPWVPLVEEVTDDY